MPGNLKLQPLCDLVYLKKFANPIVPRQWRFCNMNIHILPNCRAYGAVTGFSFPDCVQVLFYLQVPFNCGIIKVVSYFNYNIENP
jgi:hypothetical protein